MGFNCLKATATSRRQFSFYHSVPRNSWYSFYRPRKDERLSRPWSHPVVLITGPLDWESTTRPFPFLLEILVNMCFATICLPDCGVINFEINLIFLIKPFFDMIEIQNKNLNIMRTRRVFKVKSIFHHF